MREKKPTSFLIGTVLILAFSTGTLFGAARAAPVQQGQANLFVEAGAELDALASGAFTTGEIEAATTIRSRLVDIDLSLLGGAIAPASDPQQWGAGNLLTLNLFADETLIAMLDRVERNADGGYSWIGAIASVPYSSVVHLFMHLS